MLSKTLCASNQHQGRFQLHGKQPSPSLCQPQVDIQTLCLLHPGIGIAKEDTTQLSIRWNDTSTYIEKRQSKISSNTVCSSFIASRCPVSWQRMSGLCVPLSCHSWRTLIPFVWKRWVVCLRAIDTEKRSTHWTGNR